MEQRVARCARLVAQICNLLYRRIGFGKAQELWDRCHSPSVVQISDSQCSSVISACSLRAMVLRVPPSTTPVARLAGVFSLFLNLQIVMVWLVAKKQFPIEQSLKIKPTLSIVSFPTRQ